MSWDLGDESDGGAGGGGRALGRDTMGDFEVTSADGRASFALQPLGDLELSYRAVLAAGDEVRAERRVAIDRGRFVQFWLRVAEGWRDVFGPLTWEARNPSTGYGLTVLRLSASNDGLGHIVVVTELAHPYIGNDTAAEEFDTHVGADDSVDSGSWRLRVVLVVEPWQVDDLALAAGRLPHSSLGFG